MQSSTEYKIAKFNDIDNHAKICLFLPATKLSIITKAFASGADAVIIDLEDAVSPEDKSHARQALQHYYDSQNYRPIWVRINQASSKSFISDLELCQQMPKLDGVILAKAECASDIEQVHQTTGLPVIALIESAVGLYQIDNMAKAVGVIAFSYGFLDLCNDLRVQVGTAAADSIANQIRYQLVVHSRVHGLLAPIDTIYPDFSDSEGLSDRVQLWSQMGMSGMLCIHPKQVATVKQALCPKIEDIEFAKRVVAEYERSGKAVFKIEDSMVDAPVIQRCQQLLRNRDKN